MFFSTIIFFFWAEIFSFNDAMELIEEKNGSEWKILR